MKFPLKKVLFSFVAGLIVIALGFGVRYAEDNQVGMSNNVSMWVFVVGSLLVYYAVVNIISYFLKRLSRQSEKEKR